MRYIPRALAHTIRRAMTTFPAVLVARGVPACRAEQPQVLRPGIRAVPWHLAARDMSTYPHHKHAGANVHASHGPTLQEVLEEILLALP